MKQHVRQDEPEDEKGVRLGLLMRAVAVFAPAGDLDQDDCAIDGPGCKERSNASHLDHRDSPESVESLPRKIDGLSIRLLRQLWILLLTTLRVARDDLAEEVHEAEDKQDDD